ncbi:MAG TPA: M20/M25/M40 family metallo-hydrolase [Gemmatimonadaceae bacterium]|nr:M20/M25/M40 family metallo-hydrolase [Gemmatimonadaceae bacterium]
MSSRSLPAQQPLDSTVALLVDLIKVNSSSPPGRTQGLADVLAPKLRARGFEVDIIPTPDSAKVHLIARLKGNGRKRPVLIAAHGDVVGVEREKWSVDPFAGIAQDGYVLGRGAIDFKGGMAVFARAAMLLAERKVKLDRDVIFLVEADEEGALPYSSEWLAKSWWPKIDAEFALNEGGWIIQRPDGSVRYVSISTADKGTYGVILSARGTSTHSSMPVPDNAIAAVARAVGRLAAYEWPVSLTPSTRRFFQVLGRTASADEAPAFDDVVSGDSARVARGDAVISRDPLLHALLRTTWAPTIFNAGFRANVIPGSAEATVNVRTIPGTTPEMVLDRMRAIVADSSVKLSMAWAPGTPIPESPDTTALFRALTAAARATYPGAEVTPYLFQAGTDAAAWRSRGVPVYGIYPYAISAEDLKRMHGNDERVSIRSLQQGTEMIYRTLVEVAGSRR